MSELIDRDIKIGPIDVFATGVLPINVVNKGSSGRILAVSPDDSTVAIRLSEPLEWKNVIYSYVIASVRHEGRTMGELLSGHSVLCAITWISAERFDHNRPFDLSWWRGGPAGIADLKLYEDE
jgi:hypothetical protein